MGTDQCARAVDERRTEHASACASNPPPLPHSPGGRRGAVTTLAGGDRAPSLESLQGSPSLAARVALRPSSREKPSGRTHRPPSGPPTAPCLAVLAVLAVLQSLHLPSLPAGFSWYSMPSILVFVQQKPRHDGDGQALTLSRRLTARETDIQIQSYVSQARPSYGPCAAARAVTASRPRMRSYLSAHLSGPSAGAAYWFRDLLDGRPWSPPNTDTRIPHSRPQG